ncbi:Histidinol dehydrogenase, chloroplastic [Vitis vinifera]|uniref:histidinol dehydrogenase n=1 Tax=Vitis vinifera TaxID=29760 RepID=A0A438DNP4_VITVI|nr:Histidinol dehydrogenase, chloroplastic [Vitis vinifera]
MFQLTYFQAEHGPDSQVVLVIAGDGVDLRAIEEEISKQCQSLPRGEFASKALSHSFTVFARDMVEAISFSNLYAPEHLIINVKDAEKWENFIENAGTIWSGLIVYLSGCSFSIVFTIIIIIFSAVGKLTRSFFTSQFVFLPGTSYHLLLLCRFCVFRAVDTGKCGDYASGTNHVLPTYGYARMYGGLSLDSFLKYMTVQSLTEEGLRKLGPYVEAMAEVEGLEAHKRAVTLRLQDIEARQVPNMR